MAGCLVYIAEKFQRLPHILGFRELKGSIVNTVQSMQKYTIQDGYRQTSNIYIHIYIQIHTLNAHIIRPIRASITLRK